MTSRRSFLAMIPVTAGLVGSTRVFAEDAPKPAGTPANNPTPRDRVKQTHDMAVVAEFVAAAHRDLPKVEAMIAQDPRLVVAAVDTGNVGIGDWETGLNGAAHSGRRDIVEFLLSKGARIDLFCAAMLGYRDVVLGMLKVEPRAANVKGPHRLSLLYHVAIGGDVPMAEGLRPLIAGVESDFNQSLSAAARDGHAEMIKWLLTHGATNVNAPDGFRKTPLKIALEKGFTDAAAVLREHGGRETL